MRDILLFGAFAVLVPMILLHPYIGALAWVVFGIMNPHRLTYGSAYDFQFSLIIAVLTFVGIIFTREHRKIKGGAPGVALVAFTGWICLTFLFPAFNPEEAAAYLERVMKVFAMTGVILLLLHTRRHVELLVWALVVSLGYYGTKGGVFVILTGGQYMVYGPSGSVMEGNNALGVGLTIVIPLMLYLYQQHSNKWFRLAMAGAAGLCAVAVLGSYSRGALLAISAMGCLLWFRGTHKFPIFVGVLVVTLVGFTFMPEKWSQRMWTIETYEEDTSAMSRLVAWQTAFNIAKDMFPIGGGFEWQSIATSAKYFPDPSRSYVAHSIYFQTIGSQGFIGLAFFLLFWILVWRQCSWIRRRTLDHPDLRWAYSLASMAQVSLVGYAVGGAFLDLAFWDLPYYLYAAVAVTQYAVSQELARPGNAAGSAAMQGSGQRREELPSRAMGA